MRSAWLKVSLAVLAVAALVALAYRSQSAIQLSNFSWSRLVQEVAGTRKDLLLAALAAIYLAYLVRALRWRRFCRYLGPMKLGDAYKGTLMGFAAIFLLGRPAELVRPLLLARKSRLPVSSMFGIYVLERLFDTAATVVLAGLSLALFRSQFPGESGGNWEGTIRLAGGALLAGLVAFGLLLFYFRLHGAGFMERRLSRWKEAGGWRGFLATQFAGFSEGLQAIRGLSDWWAATMYSAVHWSLVVLIYLWVMHSFGGTLGALTLRSAMLALVFTMVGSLVQVPGVGGGAQVGTFLALTQIFQIEPEPAAAAAVLTWLVTFAGSCFVGLPLLIREGWTMGELRRLARAEAQAERSGTHVSLTQNSSGEPGHEHQGGGTAR